MRRLAARPTTSRFGQTRVSRCDLLADQGTDGSIPGGTPRWISNHSVGGEGRFGQVNRKQEPREYELELASGYLEPTEKWCEANHTSR